MRIDAHVCRHSRRTLFELETDKLKSSCFLSAKTFDHGQNASRIPRAGLGLEDTSWESDFSRDHEEKDISKGLNTWNAVESGCESLTGPQKTYPPT